MTITHNFIGTIKDDVILYLLEKTKLMRENMKFVSNFVTKFCNARISDWFYFILFPILVATLLFSSSIKTHINLMYKL